MGDSTITDTGSLVTFSTQLTAPRINLPNNTQSLYVGDDASIGDVNTTHAIGIKSQTDSNVGYVKFGADTNTLGYNGTTLVYGGSAIWTKAGITDTNVSNWNTAYSSLGNYLPFTGGKMLGSILFGNVSNGNTRGLYGQVGASDGWRIVGGAAADNAGYLEIATTDDGNEPIYVRQYNNGLTWDNYTGTPRTLTLLDGSGNTNIPGQLSVANSKIAFRAAGNNIDIWNPQNGNYSFHLATTSTTMDIYSGLPEGGTLRASIYGNGTISANSFKGHYSGIDTNDYAISYTYATWGRKEATAQTDYALLHEETSFNTYLNAKGVLSLRISNSNAIRITSADISVSSTIYSNQNYPFRFTHGGVSNYYLATDTNGIFLATFGSGNSGKTIFLENYDADIQHRKNGVDYKMWDAGNFTPGNYSLTGHSHDDRYYTETEVNNLLSNTIGGAGASTCLAVFTGTKTIGSYSSLSYTPGGDFSYNTLSLTNTANYGGALLHLNAGPIGADSRLQMDCAVGGAMFSTDFSNSNFYLRTNLGATYSNPINISLHTSGSVTFNRLVAVTLSNATVPTNAGGGYFKYDSGVGNNSFNYYSASTATNYGHRFHVNDGSGAFSLIASIDKNALNVYGNIVISGGSTYGMVSYSSSTTIGNDVSLAVIENTGTSITLTLPSPSNGKKLYVISKDAIGSPNPHRIVPSAGCTLRIVNSSDVNSTITPINPLIVTGRGVHLIAISSTEWIRIQ
jgi:hypothetical protein